MPSIEEEIQEQVVGRVMVDGFRIDSPNVDIYLKKLIVWIRVLLTVVLVLSLRTILIWNVFGSKNKDVSDRVIVKLLNALDTEYRAGLIFLVEPDRLSSTSTIPPNGST